MRKTGFGYLAGGAVLLAAAWGFDANAADAVDPALAKSWDFMQQQMKGVPLAVLQGACAEGNLTIYHGTWSEAQAAQVDRFKQRFPCITVQSLELESSVIRERFLTESRNNKVLADIVQDSDSGALDKEAKEGLMLDYVISNDKDYSDTTKNKGHWYPIRFGIIGNAWNTDQVKPEQAKVLADWKGIFDPAWTGKSAVIDPATGGSALLFWYAMAKKYGDQVFKEMGALKPRVMGGVNPAAAALASGDVAVLLGVSESAFTTQWLKGAPMRWSMPEPGIGAVTGQAIPAHPLHVNAAKLYQEYAFTLEGYQTWNRLGGAPARMNYQDQRDVAKESWYKYPKDFYGYDVPELLASGQQIVAKFKEAVGSSR